jgi:hypothetical protein
MTMRLARKNHKKGKTKPLLHHGFNLFGLFPTSFAAYGHVRKPNYRYTFDF